MKAVMVSKKNCFKDKQILTVVLLVGSFFIPFLINYAVLFINGYGLSLKNLVFYMNDEVFWHFQTAGAVKYGMPLGYFGYNGSSAEIGTFNTWGPFPFIPYIILGRIFGYGIYSRHIFNLLFVGVAVVIYLLLTEADIRKIIITNLILFMLPVNIAYLLTSMSEPERYSLVIILAGMFSRTVKFKTGKLFKYCIFPLFILVSCFIYYIFLVFIPLYVFLVLKDKKAYIKFISAGIVSVLAACPILILNKKMSAPYDLPSGLSETINEILLYLDMKNGLFNSIVGIVRVLLGNMAHFGPKNLINIFSMGNGFFSVYIAVYEIIIVLLCVLLYIHRKNKEIRKTYLTLLYIMSVFLLAFALLYAEDPVTVIRGLNCGWLFAITYYLATDCYILSGRLFNIVSVSLLMVVFIVGINFINGFCKGEYEASLKVEYILKEQSAIQEVMQLNIEGTVWDNTIAYYGDLGTECLEIPTGFGFNYMTDNKIDDRIGWAVIYRNNEKQNNKLYDELNSCYEQVYQNDDFFIMKNRY